MEKLRILVFMSVLFCVGAIHAQGISISGKVTSVATGKPLEGATVFLEKTTRGVIADSEGKYHLNHIKMGEYTLKASFMGYDTFSKKLTVGSENQTINIQLNEINSALSEIVVTGTGTEHYVKDAPIQTEVITGKALEDYVGRDIEDVLSGLSSSFSFNASDMGSNMQLNGLKSDYILVLLDGRRMSAGVGGQSDLSRINLNEIDRVEIVRGAVSTLYGSDAIGGVINFITKKREQAISFSTTTRVGEHEDVNSNNSLKLGYGKLTSNTGIAVKHTHGWRNTTEEWHRNKLETNSVTKTVNRSTDYSLSERLSYDINKSLQVYGDAFFYQKWTKRPMGVPNWRLSDLYYQNQTYGVGAKYKINRKHFIVYDSSFDRYDYYYDYNSREYTDFEDENGKPIIHMKGDRVLQSSERRFINNVKGVFTIFTTNTISIGVEHIWEKLVAPYRLVGNTATAFNYAGYIQDEWNISEKLNFTAGIRYDKHRDFKNTLTPKASFAYKANDKLTLRANYSQGFKAPTMKELYYHYYATIMSKFKAYYGNKDLKPQKSNYYSLSAEYYYNWLKLSVTLYHNSLRDMISLQSTETSYDDKQLLVEETMHYVNLAKARTYGLDVNSDITLPYHLSLGLGYSFLHAKNQRTDDEDADDYMKWINMNATARHTANFKLSWWEKWNTYRLGLTLTGRYQSKKYFTSHGTAKAYQIWRLNTSHGLINKKKFKLDINLGIDNIFDFVDREPFGHNRATTSPGRNYFASITMKFQNGKMK